MVEEKAEFERCGQTSDSADDKENTTESCLRNDLGERLPRFMTNVQYCYATGYSA